MLEEFDPEISDAVKGELEREAYSLEMIASENFVSKTVMEALGSVLTNKYAEGYPGKRYYGGCEHVDIAENLAIERAKKLFNAEHANVQPHSGSQANMAVYHTLLQPGDTILGMNLSHGGHLTHGCPVNFSGYTYQVVAYGVNQDTELIDRAIIKCGITDLENRRFTTLSAGEKQRVWLTFCLAQEKPFLLLDESLSLLDVFTKHNYFKLLKQLASEGKGILLVTHDIDLAKEYADKVVVLGKGKIIFNGEPKEFCSEIMQLI